MKSPAKSSPWIDNALVPLINVLAAFFIAGLVVLFIAENPLRAVRILLSGALGYGEGIGFTLFYATNFIFTGLAVAVAFHAGLFNIGGEGQAYVGGLGVALAALSLDMSAPWWTTALGAIAASSLFGAAWAFIPAYLQARRGSHIVITTIMFNFLAAALMVYLLSEHFRPPGSMDPASRTFADGGILPQLHGLFALVGLDLGGAPANLSLLLALLCAVLVWFLIWRTKLGYEIRTVGQNPDAALYAGISVSRIAIIAMLISGALAGMMALNPIMGEQHRLQVDFVFGAGFVGIAVALIGRSHPVGIVLASLLFGILYQGGNDLSFEIPAITRDMILVIQALVILFAGALEHMFRPAIGRAWAVLSTTRRRTLPDADDAASVDQ